jgi:hypothetical protein
VVVPAARVVAYDPSTPVFEHISQSDDGNPTYVHWRWSVVPAPGGARVTVAWSGHPKTFWRQLLVARIRRKQLQLETSASLDALAYHLADTDLPDCKASTSRDDRFAAQIVASPASTSERGRPWIMPSVQ